MESEIEEGHLMKQKRHSETGGGVAGGLPLTGSSQGLQFEITVSPPGQEALSSFSFLFTDLIEISRRILEAFIFKKADE